MNVRAAALFLVACATTPVPTDDAEIASSEAELKACRAVQRVSSTSSYDWSTHVTTVTVAFLVDLPLNVIRRNVDPQSWDDCSPRFFPATYILDGAATEPGSDWDATLYEDVGITVAGAALSSIKNHLHLSSARFEASAGHPLVHRWEYSLAKSLSVEVMGHRYADGLDLDDGYLTVEETPSGKYLVSGLKQIHFAEESAPTLGAIANAASPPLFKKILSDLGYDLLCCER